MMPSHVFRFKQRIASKRNGSIFIECQSFAQKEAGCVLHTVDISLYVFRQYVYMLGCYVERTHDHEYKSAALTSPMLRSIHMLLQQLRLNCFSLYLCFLVIHEVIVTTAPYVRYTPYSEQCNLLLASFAVAVVVVLQCEWTFNPFDVHLYTNTFPSYCTGFGLISREARKGT